jgi:MFS family permease
MAEDDRMSEWHEVRVARRITITLLVVQSLVSAAFVASGTISVLVVAALSGGPTWAGLGTSIFQIGSALAALGVSAVSDRIGRRLGLALGLGLGVLGAGLSAMAIVDASLLLFLGASVLLGVASAAVRLARFAAAEVHAPESRGRAIATVVMGGAVGAVVGPLLIGPSARWAARLGSDELAGPFLTGIFILALAAVVVIAWLHPDPRDVGRQIAVRYPETAPGREGSARPARQILATPAGALALTAMIVGQVAMAMVTGMVSLHMRGSGQGLFAISLVMAIHTVGMFVLSPVAGRLTDRWGRGPVIVSGAAMLVVSSAVAPLSSNVVLLSIALFLVGVGWNFCYVGGSALLSDQLAPAERASTQGTNDLVVGLTTAMASLGSGLIYAGAGYGVVGLVASAASLAPLALAGWWLARRREAGARLVPADGCVAGAEAFARFAPQDACRV